MLENNELCSVAEAGPAMDVKDDSGAEKQLRVFQLSLYDTKVTVGSLGASLLEILTPLDDDALTNWIVGYDSVEDMWKQDNPAYFSVIPGRVANRIRHGRLQLDPNNDTTIHQLAINNPPNHLHGGPVGFSHKVWDAQVIRNETGDVVRFTLVSPDMDQDYPGAVRVTADYTLQCTPKTNIVKLRLSIKATLLKDSPPTPVNLTQHAYFNLAGRSEADGILNHKLRINADAFTPVDVTSIPTRHVQSLDEDPTMDFRRTRRIRDALMDYGMHKCGKTSSEVERDLRDRTLTLDAPYGFDHNYVVRSARDNTALQHVATLQWNKQRLTVCSNAPGVQLYTGNYLDGSVAYRWQGLCLETQHFPDSVCVDPVEHSSFYQGKCPVLTPASPNYSQDIEYTIEYRKNHDCPTSTHGFQGTALDGSRTYSSVEELWEDQGVSDDCSAAWYRRAAAYYDDSCPPTIDGVLGGFASISGLDLEGSLHFVTDLVQVRPEAIGWLTPLKGGSCRACECGAGLGRITKGLLLSSALPGLTHCDLVEVSESLLCAAPEYLGDSISSKCRFFCVGLQDWEPAASTYSLIWIQWVLSYLTDRDIVEFLGRCGQALQPGGLIVLKENMCEASDFELDAEDASVTRSPRYWQYLIRRAGFRVAYQSNQQGLPVELYPVHMLALELLG